MKLRCIAYFALLIAVATVLTIGANAQNNPSSPKPDDEKFTKADYLAVAWRETGCKAEPKARNSECFVINGDEYDQNGKLSLFNADGSEWFRFGLRWGKPDHFAKLNKATFIPFSYIGTEYLYSAGPVLRLVGISPSWFEVEVNEKTRSTKFVSRKDTAWTKVSWEYWWRSDPRVYIDRFQTKLFDKPNGSAVENPGLTYFLFQEISGDWARLEGSMDGSVIFSAWVRWRDGRDINIGCVFNAFKRPAR